MDPLMDVIKNYEEPEWLERTVFADVRVWQVAFICLAGVTTIIVIVCCCFRFRIPRTKQQIEADYQRRKIAKKFQQKLKTIQDTKMDELSLTDALELFHECKAQMEGTADTQPDSQNSPTATSQQQGSSCTPQDSEKKLDQPSGVSFAKMAGKVATIAKLGQPSPTSPSNSSRMNF